MTDLDQLLRDNGARLARIARHYARAGEQQDLLQEITIALWRGLARFEGKSKLSTWVYRVAINTALQYVRRRQLPVEPLQHEPQGATDMADAMMLLDEFLNGLSPVDRAILLLDLEGVERPEAAEIMGLSEGAIAVRMTRMKAAFTEKYLEE
ncbi:MAG: sigma-70 family RNA polymerase sigma factor [Wenzhouxiangella sp.]|jgi:RNA polymerase sigma-70 factor (ECF subfamily)|nr:sigma-70 family RNA polymerase sigma factor [Wenzhouxiangella sp.]